MLLGRYDAAEVDAAEKPFLTPVDMFESISNTVDTTSDANGDKAYIEYVNKKLYSYLHEYSRQIQAAIAHNGAEWAAERGISDPLEEGTPIIVESTTQYGKQDESDALATRRYDVTWINLHAKHILQAMVDVQEKMHDPLKTDPIIVFTLMQEEDFDEDDRENSRLSTVTPADELIAKTNREGVPKPYQVAVRYGALLRLMPRPFWNAIKTALMEPEGFAVTDYSGARARSRNEDPASTSTSISNPPVMAKFSVDAVRFNDEAVTQVGINVGGRQMTIIADDDHIVHQGPHPAIVANMPERIQRWNKKHTEPKTRRKQLPLSV